jgi:hypothetical protein
MADNRDWQQRLAAVSRNSGWQQQLEAAARSSVCQQRLISGALMSGIISSQQRLAAKAARSG